MTYESHMKKKKTAIVSGFFWQVVVPSGILFGFVSRTSIYVFSGAGGCPARHSCPMETQADYKGCLHSWEAWFRVQSFGYEVLGFKRVLSDSPRPWVFLWTGATPVRSMLDTLCFVAGTDRMAMA